MGTTSACRTVDYNRVNVTKSKCNGVDVFLWEVGRGEPNEGARDVVKDALGV